MTEIEKFTPAFPNSKFQNQISQLALYSLRQLNQPQRLEEYGQKTLAANPNSIPTLLMMGDAYAATAKDAAKAATYANKALALVGPNPDTKEKKSYAGLAHVTLGRAELNQDKFIPAVTDLKTASTLLQDDPQDQQQALFYLGYAYAKQNHKADAVASLQRAAAINGPYAAPARDMLAKINAAGAGKKQ
jgi:cytochrome c-type biogenesis protein CcmH/NrfG